MQNYKLTLAYDGTRYMGWQRQTDTENTIQGKLESVLSQLDGSTVETHGSGRTDAGVHARGQVVSFALNKETDCDTVLAYLRQYLPHDIGALSLEKADVRFHARLNAKSKTYRYTVWTDSTPCIFERKYVYVFQENLNLTQMRSAATHLCGTHDFAAFSSTKSSKKSTVRTISSIDIEPTPHGIQFKFIGDGFMHHMVRILVGTLLEVGKGTRTAESVTGLFAGSRSDAGFTAPAKGLCLMEVRY